MEQSRSANPCQRRLSAHKLALVSAKKALRQRTLKHMQQQAGGGAGHDSLLRFSISQNDCNVVVSGKSAFDLEFPLADIIPPLSFRGEVRSLTALAVRRSGEGEVGHCLHRRSPSPTAPRPFGQGFVSSPLKGRGEISHKDTKARRREGAKARRRTTHFPSRHPELGSGSIVQRHPVCERTSNRASRLGLSQPAQRWADKWTLKRVQGDGAL
jgi:hypothetical protein